MFIPFVVMVRVGKIVTNVTPLYALCTESRALLDILRTSVPNFKISVLHLSGWLLAIPFKHGLRCVKVRALVRLPKWTEPCGR